jgi:hypothetical protein
MLNRLYKKAENKTREEVLDFLLDEMYKYYIQKGMTNEAIDEYLQLILQKTSKK